MHNRMYGSLIRHNQDQVEKNLAWSLSRDLQPRQDSVVPILQLTHAFLVDRETSAPHPIRHNPVAAARHDRLRVKLHTMQRQRRMPHGHHHPRIRPAGHHQFLRQRRLIHRQRVISRHGHGIRQPPHHTRTVVPHRRCLPVQQLVRTDNRTAQSLGQHLMSQTDTCTSPPAARCTAQGCTQNCHNYRRRESAYRQY